jgi:formylglycine-generating enzyme required for sulfatase activity
VCDKGDWVVISAGTFTMGAPKNQNCSFGNEHPPFEVQLTHPFVMRETELTQGEWKALMGNNPSTYKQCGDNCPVDKISWLDALSYCNKLSASQGLEECYVINGEKSSWPKGYACKGYRLPTEAEWEYAYRATTTTALYNGLELISSCEGVAPEVQDIAWYGENHEGIGVHPCKKKQPNKWGLYDIAGNVWELTWGAVPYGNKMTDPIGVLWEVPTLPGVPQAVIRGGGVSYQPRGCTATHRNNMGATQATEAVGFRPVRTLK